MCLLKNARCVASLAGAPKTLAQHNWGPNLPVAFSIWNKFHRNQTEIMGYTVRVEDWRYTAWFEFDWVATRPVYANVSARELYDLALEIAPADAACLANRGACHLHLGDAGNVGDEARLFHAKRR